MYLDSRLARGLFTSEDVDILRGIGNLIAFTIATARTAQLEVVVESERAQRKLAETLRSVSATLNATLHLDTVLGRLLESLTKVVPYDRALVMLREDAGFKVVAARAHGEEMIGRVIDPSTHPQLRRIISRETPYVSESARHYLEDHDVRSWVGVPLVVRDRVVGILTIDSLQGARYDDSMASIVVTFAEQAATAVENARLFEEAERRATTDPLTNALNRGQLFMIGEQMLRRAHRNRESISVLLVDVDHFKRVNDTYGHAAGDRVLIQVVRAMQGCLRASDILGRYGGEEFGIVLPEADAEGAELVAARLLAAISSLTISSESGPIRVTVSIGSASIVPETASELSKLFARADAALYRAKDLGRNRVTSAQSSGTQTFFSEPSAPGLEMQPSSESLQTERLQQRRAR